MKLDELRQNIQREFTENGFDSPEIETAYLLEEATGIRHNLLWTEKDRILTDSECRDAEAYLARRLKQEPFQYICGWTQFRDLKLTVRPGCLIPRPETELIIDAAKKVLPAGGTVCELGTGSGAIALSIAQERRDCTVYASEISPEALAIAEENLAAYPELKANVHLMQGDLFAPFPGGMQFDLLLANLPYIPESERTNLPENVRNYEPETALFADHEGLAVMERALRDAAPYLKTGAWLIFETGSEQGNALCQYADSLGCYTSCAVLRDQYGANRFFTCRKADVQ